MADEMDVDSTNLTLSFVLVANGRAFVRKGATRVGLGEVDLPRSSSLPELRKEIVKKRKQLLDNISPQTLIVYTTELNRKGSAELLAQLDSTIADQTSVTLDLNKPNYRRMGRVALLHDVFQLPIDPRAIHLIVDCTEAGMSTLLLSYHHSARESIQNFHSQKTSRRPSGI